MKNYKILKLKSGEDIIGTVRISRDGSIKIHRPMIFKSAFSQDPFFGSVKEYFLLKNWLVMSSDTVATLSKESINTIVNASKEVSNLYDIEKAKEDASPNKYKPKVFDAKDKQKSTLPSPIQDDANTLNDLKRYVEEMIQESEKAGFQEESNLKDLAKHKPGDKMVFMNMVFSPEVIVELLRSGILDRKEFGEMINEITNENGEGMNPQKFTGNKKDKKNLGNDWTDWNADPDSQDYK